MKQLFYLIMLSAYLTFMSVSCSSEKSKSTDEHHNHEEHAHDESESHDDQNEHFEELESLSYTILNDEYELFVEFTPLIVGQASEFITHFTKVTNYKPVTQGVLTVSLINENNRINAKVEKPNVPGIFIPTLEPKQAGSYTLVFDLESSGTTKTIEISDVEVFPNEEEAIHHTDHSEAANDITYLKEQAWKTEFGIQKISRASFREVISTSGQIMPASGDETTLVSPFSGIITTGKSLVEGRFVNKGQTLLSLSGKGLASDNISVHYTHLKSNYEQAKADYDRAKALVENKIVSQKEFQEAKANYEKAKADFENAAFSSDGVKNNVEANMSGYIKDILITDGQFVESGTPLVRIAQNKRLLIRADVSQNHWHCLPEIVEANFITPYDSRTYNTSELKGQLISYSRNASNSVWSTPVFFEINNEGNLIPGTFIEVYLLSKPIPNIISIPLTALIEDQGNFFVFVQLSGENYQKREVKTGSGNGREIEITSGLEPGEIIVTKGAYQLKLASATSALPAHAHNH